MFKNFFLFLLITCLSSVSLAASPQVLEVNRIGSHPGNPGATIYSLTFNDGMDIKVAVYPGRGQPLVGLGGYMGSFGYLHPFVRKVQNETGRPVFLVQLPGQGEEGVYSGNPQRVDGYWYTMEGMATLYLQAAGEAIQKAFHPGEKALLFGHSRSGYILEFFASGYRLKEFRGEVPVLDNPPENFEATSRVFAGIFPLFSPTTPDAELVWGVRALPEHISRLRTLEERSEVARARVRRAVDRVAFGLDMMSWGATHFVRRMTEIAVTGGVEGIMKREAISFLLSDRPVREEYLRLQRLGAGDYLPSLRDLERGVALQRTLLARDPLKRQGLDKDDLRHVVDHWGRAIPPFAAQEELYRLTEGTLWQTQGVNPNGKHIGVFRAVVQARKKGMGPPLHIIHAQDDGPFNQREVSIDARSKGVVIDGGHGGSLYDPQSSVKIIEFMEECAGLMAEI